MLQHNSTATTPAAATSNTTTTTASATTTPSSSSSSSLLSLSPSSLQSRLSRTQHHIIVIIASESSSALCLATQGALRKQVRGQHQRAVRVRQMCGRHPLYGRLPQLKWPTVLLLFLKSEPWWQTLYSPIPSGRNPKHSPSTLNPFP